MIWQEFARLFTPPPHIGSMMYPSVKTEKVGVLKCMYLLPNRRTLSAFTRY